eukprot:g1277.t1
MRISSFVLLYILIVEVAASQSNAVENDPEVCYFNHDNYNQSNCISQVAGATGKILSNITADSLLTILNTTNSMVFVAFYDNTTRAARPVLQGIEGALNKIDTRRSTNTLFATMRISDEKKFATANNVNNDVSVSIFLPGYERLILPLKFSLRTLLMNKEKIIENMIAEKMDSVLDRLDGQLQIFNDYLAQYFLENQNDKNDDDRSNKPTEQKRLKSVNDRIQKTLSNMLADYDEKHRKSHSTFKMSMIKEAGSIYISQMRAYFNAKQSGIMALRQNLEKFHDSLRLKKCGKINVCLLTYKKLHVVQQLLSLLLPDGRELSTVKKMVQFFKVQDAKRIDKMRLGQGIPTLDDLKRIKDPSMIVQLLKQM